MYPSEGRTASTAYFECPVFERPGFDAGLFNVTRRNQTACF
jgi:hypothetical protein